ncbi:hypothetical protein [Okeania sp. SIO2G5]|uniref:hypothetical protein n=1 Tax=Okeania sp. SIO2G5 TaxID=2607796 RepID=UPI0013B77B79|nr:hypothetical protein [Okeania sp. SIO2G5]NEP72800.1 hypothetical protein [Okeania sp. SIO2G5]NEP93490.1 hypothetical protein [Okeania sp. SIO2F5]
MPDAGSDRLRLASSRGRTALLVDWIWRGDPFLQTRSEDRHPTLREATLTTALLKGDPLSSVFIALTIRNILFLKWYNTKKIVKLNFIIP